MSCSNCIPHPPPTLGLCLTLCTPLSPSLGDYTWTGVAVCFISFHRGKRETLWVYIEPDSVVFIPGFFPFSYSYFVRRPVFLLLNSSRVDSFSIQPHSFIPMFVLLFALPRLGYVCVYLCRLLSLPTTTIPHSPLVVTQTQET